MGDDRITPHDADELARCFAAHAARLFGQACVLARGDRARAEELVQATFEAGGRVWPTLRGLAAEPLRDWLWSMLAQIAASGLRRDPGYGDRLPPIEVRDLGFTPEPAEHEFSASTLERCWRAILQLPEPAHMVAMFRWQLDMKEAEIAAALGLASGTVSVLLDRTRRKLIAQLGPDHPFSRDDPEGASS